MLKAKLTSGHFGLEHLDHVVECAGSADLGQQAVQLALVHQHAHIVESSAQVVFVDGAVLVFCCTIDILTRSFL